MITRPWESCKLLTRNHLREGVRFRSPRKRALPLRSYSSESYEVPRSRKGEPDVAQAQWESRLFIKLVGTTAFGESASFSLSRRFHSVQ